MVQHNRFEQPKLPVSKANRHKHFERFLRVKLRARDNSEYPRRLRKARPVHSASRSQSAGSVAAAPSSTIYRPHDITPSPQLRLAAHHHICIARL